MRSNPDLPYAVVGRKIPTKSYGILKWDPFDINDTAHDPSRRFVGNGCLRSSRLTGIQGKSILTQVAFEFRFCTGS
jgi:hypothetical protein